MSDEKILGDLDKRIFAFWEALRSFDVRESSVYGALFLLSFLHDRALLLLPHFGEDDILEAEVFSFAGVSDHHERAAQTFEALKSEVSSTVLWGLCVDFASLVEGLSDEEFQQLASAILDELPARFGKFGSVFPLPKKVAGFMVAATSRPSTESSDVFSPFVPHADLADYVGERVNVGCQVPTSAAAACMAVHLMVSGSRADIRIADSEERWNSFQWPFERVVAAPPFGKRLHRNHWSRLPDTESFCVQQVAEMLEPGGIGAVCVTPRFLFRSTGSIAALRRSLIEDGQVEAVVQLPGNLAQYTSLAPVILILRAKGSGASGVRMIDASDCAEGEGRSVSLNLEKATARLNDWKDPRSRTVTLEELRENEFDLSPARHLGSGHQLLSELGKIEPGHELIRLSELAKPMRAPRAHAGDFGVYLPRRSFPESTHRFEESFASADEVAFETIERPRQPKRISSDCLLVDTLASRNELKALWFTYGGKDLFVEPEILALEVSTDRVDGRWLALALRSDAVSKQIKSLLVGGTVPRLRTALLMGLQIVVPSDRSQQIAVLRSAEELQFKAKAKEIGLERILDESREEFRRDLRLKKHSLAQVANDIKGRINTITKLLERQGKLDADELVGSLAPMPSAEYLRQIAVRCGHLGSILESLTEAFIFRPLGPLALEEAFRDLRGSARGRDFKFSAIIHKETFVDPLTGNRLKPVLQIAAEDFAELCENIIENASRHGFSDPERERSIRIEAGFLGEEQMIELSFMNTGCPLPEGLTTERFVTRGEKAGPSGHTGAGGYHIKALMDHVGGSVEIRNLSDGIFTVETRLLFPFQS